MRPTYRSQILDHLGLVAALFDELGIGGVIDQATQQHPAMRIVTAGTAVKAMVLNGRGFVNPPRYLVPHFFQHKPTTRRFASCIEAHPRTDDAWGRALDTLQAHGVTALHRLMAATAATRLGLAPTCAHLDRTRVHGDGRDNRDEDADEPVVHMTPGDRRDHRPALNPVMLDVMVEHQAGIPIVLKPLSGKSRAGRNVGPVVSAPMAPVHTPDGPTSRGADGALQSADNLPKLSATPMQWSTRVPATWRAAHATLAQAEPQPMAPLPEGDRDHACTSTDGEVAPRWMLIDAEARPPPAPHPVDTQLRQPRAQETRACPHLCRPALACETAAQQALSTFQHGFHRTDLHAVTLPPAPHSRKRGRPGQGAHPDRGRYYLAGALASAVRPRAALVAQPSGVLLATKARDDTPWSPAAWRAGDTGQPQAERGVRFRQDPQFLASALDLKTPERIMALLMVMTVCLCVYAALESRLRTALKDHDPTFPNQPGQPVHNPTARWVFHDGVGSHRLVSPGPWPQVVHLTEAHQHRLQLLGKPDVRVYA